MTLITHDTPDEAVTNSKTHDPLTRLQQRVIAALTTIESGQCFTSAAMSEALGMGTERAAHVALSLNGLVRRGLIVRANDKPAVWQVP